MKKEELIEISLFDFDLTVNENLAKNPEQYVLLKVSEEKIGIEENIYPIPDNLSTCLVSSKKLKRQETMNFLIFDYDSIFGTRYNIFKCYDYKFFSCDERVFFEVLLIKYKKADYKEFLWDLSKVQYELGIKRKRLNTIILNFVKLGIITKKYTVKGAKKNCDTPFNRGTKFDISLDRIWELLPKIYADFALDKVRSDIEKYIRPTQKI